MIDFSVVDLRVENKVFVLSLLVRIQEYSYSCILGQDNLIVCLGGRIN